jgi:hypothetical protein
VAAQRPPQQLAHGSTSSSLNGNTSIMIGEKAADLILGRDTDQVPS